MVDVASLKRDGTTQEVHACQYHRSGGSTRPALDCKRGAHRSLPIVLLCDPVAVQRHEPVAAFLAISPFSATAAKVPSR
jgi:hypothetical protein